MRRQQQLTKWESHEGKRLLPETVQNEQRNRSKHSTLLQPHPLTYERRLKLQAICVHQVAFGCAKVPIKLLIPTCFPCNVLSTLMQREHWDPSSNCNKVDEVGRENARASKIVCNTISPTSSKKETCGGGNLGATIEQQRNKNKAISDSEEEQAEEPKGIP
ncbi:Hypothetical predicted protein [Podarcis lilfordi]|uniref:Uncharacterized protein n=1 Tax=Podarcis lilfordi TaxID=74358 RepID=A0AA35JP33_9SAUR|nr:Hypothetical predicted protein [Podarcis lilfordi]